jgi:hypothetical protein
MARYPVTVAEPGTMFAPIDVTVIAGSVNAWVKRKSALHPFVVVQGIA